jgi:putative DNA primase/helicase
MIDPENEAPRRGGRGASQDSACDRKLSELKEANPNLSTDQLIERLRKNIPAELQERPQWVVWKLIKRKDSEKLTKVPFNARTGELASTTNSETWSSFESAVEALRHGGYTGVGFIFTEDDPYVGIDFDHVRTDAGWDEGVLEHVYRINGYTETSPSGDGIHVIAQASVNLSKNRCAFGEGCGFEIYSEGRYFTVTGNAWEDVHAKTIRDATVEVKACIAEYLGSEAVTSDPPPLAATHSKRKQNSDQAAEDRKRIVAPPAAIGSSNSEAHLDAILACARTAPNGSKFVKLFDEGDTSDYQGDHSAADLALCGLLAHWTRKRSSVIDELFRRSKLMRPKWDEQRGKQTYGQRTIARATAESRNHGQDKTPKTPHQFKCTDLGNAERFAHDHGRDHRYVHTWGQWLIWDGKRWKKDVTDEIFRRAKKTIRNIYQEAAATTDDAARAAIAAWAKRSEAQGRVNALIELAKAEPTIAITHEVLDAAPYLFNCTNGTLCLKTGQLREHRREDCLTKLSPVTFQADASCPKWLRFLDRIMGGDAELIKFLQRFSGYSLTADVSEQCLAFLYGSGSNGKSTFVETLNEVWGDYFQRAPSSLIVKRPDGSDGIPNDIARLPGARMVVTSEVEDGCRMAESRIKDLTGGDRLIARFMRQEFFEFDPTHKIWIYGNHRPYIVGTDLGIWRRIMQIPFEVTIPAGERDLHLKESLIAEELPGILAWCVAGCLEWQQNGLNPPPKVVEATEEYRAEMDTVGQFIDERCLCSPPATIGKDELYREYQTWSEESGLRSLSKNRFGRRVKEKTFHDTRSGGRRIWIGLALQPR